MPASVDVGKGIAGVGMSAVSMMGVTNGMKRLSTVAKSAKNKKEIEKLRLKLISLPSLPTSRKEIRSCVPSTFW